MKRLCLRRAAGFRAQAAGWPGRPHPEAAEGGLCLPVGPSTPSVRPKAGASGAREPDPEGPASAGRRGRCRRGGGGTGRRNGEIFGKCSRQLGTELGMKRVVCGAGSWDGAPHGLLSSLPGPGGVGTPIPLASPPAPGWGVVCADAACVRRWTTARAGVSGEEPGAAPGRPPPPPPATCAAPPPPHAPPGVHARACVRAPERVRGTSEHALAHSVRRCDRPACVCQQRAKSGTRPPQPPGE